MRFSIRDILWLTALSGITAAWWIDSTTAQVQIDKCHRQLKACKQELWDSNSDMKAWKLESQRWMKRWGECRDGYDKGPDE